MKEIISILENYVNNFESFDEDNYPIGWNENNWKEISSLITNSLKNYNLIKKDNSELKDKIKDFELKMNSTIIGPYEGLNSKYTGYLIENVNYLRFNSLNPEAFLFLIKNKIISIPEEYEKGISYIIENYNKLKNKLSKKALSIVKIFKNHIYLLINQKKIECDNPYYLSYFTNIILYDIHTQLGENVIYSNVDECFFKNGSKIIKLLLKDYFNDFDIGYEINNIEKFMIFDYRKYIIINNGEINIKGFKKI